MATHTPVNSKPETEKLLTIVKKYRDILECKETNNVKNR